MDERSSGKKLKVKIVGHSQVKRLNPEKLCNRYRDVEVIGKSGLRMKQVVAKANETDKAIIIVHAGTNNLSTRTPEQLSKEVLGTLQKIQENNKQSKIFFLNT